MPRPRLRPDDPHDEPEVLPWEDECLWDVSLDGDVCACKCDCLAFVPERGQVCETCLAICRPEEE